MKILLVLLLALLPMLATAGPAADKVVSVLTAINGAPVTLTQANKIVAAYLVEYKSWIPESLHSENVCDPDTVDGAGALLVAGECRVVQTLGPTDPAAMTVEERAQFFLNVHRQVILRTVRGVAEAAKRTELMTTITAEVKAAGDVADPFGGSK